MACRTESCTYILVAVHAEGLDLLDGLLVVIVVGGSIVAIRIRRGTFHLLADRFE